MVINITTICTGKYTVFFDILYKSCEKYFLPKYKKVYHVFTDGEVRKEENVNVIYQEKLGWPYDTMMRFNMFNSLKLDSNDFMYFLNANMEVVSEIGEEVIPHESNDYLMGVQHPGYYNVSNQFFPYERNLLSRFYIPAGGKFYFQGCFNGGRVKEFLNMSKELSAMIYSDLSIGHIPLWHDESALNWYYIFRNPLVLNPSYAYPENWNIPFSKKIVQLDKTKFGGHEALRS